MRVRMFKPQFAGLVKSGQKRQTIRPLPVCWPKVGSAESWRQWSGLPYRSKQIELVKVRLTTVLPISFNFYPGEDVVSVDGQLLPLDQFHSLAVADGFKDWNEMAAWFIDHYGSAFSGLLIRAEDL